MKIPDSPDEMARTWAMRNQPGPTPRPDHDRVQEHVEAEEALETWLTRVLIVVCGLGTWKALELLWLTVCLLF